MELQARIREQILSGDRYWHAVVIALGAVVAITLTFSLWRIIETSRWLQDHRTYIRDRDARWEPFLQTVGANVRRNENLMKAVEEHLTKQDSDYSAIKTHMENHERMMDQSKSK